MTPGTMTETPTPRPASSPARLSAKQPTPALAAEYTASPGTPVAPAMEETKTTWPRPRSVMPCTSSLVSWIGAVRFTAMRAAACSAVIPGHDDRDSHAPAGQLAGQALREAADACLGRGVHGQG